MKIELTAWSSGSFSSPEVFRCFLKAALEVQDRDGCNEGVELGDASPVLRPKLAALLKGEQVDLNGGDVVELAHLCNSSTLHVLTALGVLTPWDSLDAAEASLAPLVKLRVRHMRAREVSEVPGDLEQAMKCANALLLATSRMRLEEPCPPINWDVI